MPALVALLSNGCSSGGDPIVLALGATVLSDLMQGDAAEATQAQVVAHGGHTALQQCLHHTEQQLQAQAARKWVCLHVLLYS